MGAPSARSQAGRPQKERTQRRRRLSIDGWGVGESVVDCFIEQKRRGDLLEAGLCGIHDEGFNTSSSLESKDLGAVFLGLAEESDAPDVQFVSRGKSRFAVRTEGRGEVRVLFLRFVLCRRGCKVSGSAGSGSCCYLHVGYPDKGIFALLSELCNLASLSAPALFVG